MQQPTEDIESLLKEIVDILDEGKPTFGSNGLRRSVEVDPIYGIVEEISQRFPQEFNDARRIVREESEVFERAQQQADAIIADAQQQAMILAGDQEIVRLAQQQADDIRDRAQQYERDTRYNAEEYADTVLAHLEDNLKSIIGTVSRVRQTLSENSGPRNQTNNVPW